MFRRLLALLLILPSLAFAQQSWPVYENIYLNDYAGIIDEDAETRIVKQIQVLREETGVELTVLTLPTRQGFTPSATMEDFATGLFNHWGIGDANRNDGVLVMVLRNDREMRIELGDGYDRAFNREAQDIIDRVFIPAFKRDAYSEGIEAGTDAVIARIARVHASGETPSRELTAEEVTPWVLGTLFAIMSGIALFWRRISDRLTRCPKCGERGIHTKRKTLTRATRSRTGRGEKTTTCPHCDHHFVTGYTIPRISSSSSSSSGGSFGGGSSSGGGASGRW